MEKFVAYHLEFLAKTFLVAGGNFQTSCFETNLPFPFREGRYPLVTLLDKLLWVLDS